MSDRVRADTTAAPSLADMLLAEPRLLACLLRWMLRRHQANAPGQFGYHRSRTILVLTFLGLAGVEIIGTHLVLLVIFGSRLWVWLLFAVDAYTIVWILGFYASLIVLPHRIEADLLRLRYGCLSELTLPRAAIRGARTVAGAEGKNGKLIIDDTGDARYACGGTTVAIDLDPEVAPRFRGGRPVPAPISTLRITVDAPREFIAALTHAPAGETGAGH